MSEEAPSTCATCQSTSPSLALQHTLGEPAPAAACDLTIRFSRTATLHDLLGLLAYSISLSHQAHSVYASAGCVAFKTPSTMPCLSYLTLLSRPLPSPDPPLSLPAHGGRPDLLNKAYALQQTGFCLL